MSLLVRRQINLGTSSGHDHVSGSLEAGFTLLELLAVITLIGWITILASPRFLQSLERNELMDVSRLLAADLEAVQVAAVTGGGGIAVNFNPEGYSFNLGERNFSRSFTRFQFRFELEEPEPETEPSSSAPPKASVMLSPDAETSPNAGTSPGTGTSSDAETGGPTAGISSNTVEFAADGSCGGLTLNWQTVHFKGKMMIGRDGVMQWNLAPK